MAKCIRCGKGTTFRGTVKLSDAVICGVCFKELGFEKRDLLTASVYKYDSIKDGRDAYYLRNMKKSAVDTLLDSVSVKIVGGGNNHELICTEEEREIFDIIRSVCDDDNLESDNIKLMRKSDNYVSVVMPSSKGYGNMDLARVKFTNRAKWIQLAPEFEKVKITTPEDVSVMAEDVRNAYRFNEPYL
jgi:hypothetical protein